ncbi:MAG: TOBE domain-containing protein [Bacteroidota bacterium]
MNSFQGQISTITTSGNLSIVSVKLDQNIMVKAIVVEAPESSSLLQENGRVKVLFKETEVVLGVGQNLSVSLQNQIPGKIKAIKKGALLSRVHLDTKVGEIVSVISTKAVHTLGLKENSEGLAMIKLNEVMLASV